jgi:endonuclease/exonuclease/phosphatase family metal-dependent hydrolase
LSNEDRLRSATYNIHYGYDDDWHFTLEKIAETIKAEDVDVIALQEVDTGRMTSYCVDDAYYLGRQLGMSVAYLPTVEKLTGIALLYRGPSAPPETMLLTSLQEQTGIVHVRLDLDKKEAVDSYGIWMGLSDEDTTQQIQEALAFIGDKERVTFGGDFNAELGSPVVDAILIAGFIDPFAALGMDPAPPTSPAIQPDSRIDFVWLRGLSISDAQVSDSLASDHRMVVVEAMLSHR